MNAEAKCHKSPTFKTRIGAKIALANLQKKGHDVKRIYWCDQHQGFHTTSKK